MTKKSTLNNFSFSGVKQLFLLLLLIPFFNNCAAQALPMPDHIVMLIEENQPNFFVMGNTAAAPYINALAADSNAAVFTKMFALEHPSQPDYFDLFAGSNQGVLDDAVPANYPFTTPNMARELMDKGFSFVTYSQNLPAMGSDVGSSNGYARKHNPVANWVGTGTNQVPATCNETLNAWPTDFTLLPTVSYVVPVEDSDMHNGFGNATIKAGDFWMHEHLDSFFHWAMTHNSLFIYTFDEDNGLQGNNIPTVFYGPMVKGGNYDDTWNLYNMLRTIEDMYGTTHAGNAATVIPITNCWKTVATDINHLENNVSLNVYPNPSSTYIDFDVRSLSDENKELAICDITGKTLSINSMPQSKKLHLNTADLANGIYFYKLLDSNNLLKTGKFIVSR